MRVALALLPLLLTGATDEDAAEADGTNDALLAAPVLRESATEQFTIPDRGRIDKERCNDYIRQVRRDRDLPELRREPAEPGDAALWSAVDRRIAGCPVLVRHGNPDDIHPIPEPSDGPLFRRIPVDD